MEMAYIQAENLKHKRTFTKTLMVLAPFVTALMNFFAPLIDWCVVNANITRRIKRAVVKNQ